MNIQFNRAGTWQEVSKEEFLELVSKGVIRPETEVIVNDKKGVAAKVKGIVFPTNNVTVTPPVPQHIETKQPETEIYDFASLPLSSFAEPNSVFDALPAEHTPFAVPVPVARRQIDELPIGRKPLAENTKHCQYCKSEINAAATVCPHCTKHQNQGAVYGCLVLLCCLIIGAGVIISTSADKIKQLEKKANQGDANAQLKLGFCYVNGEGVNEDYTEAVKWFEKAATQGHADAQIMLGTCYYNGEGVRKDYAEAVKWLEKAATQGHAVAQFTLGVCYDNGEGVRQDYAEAVKWYEKAATQGNAKAQRNLGLCYQYGQGVRRDYAEAVKWYEKAATQGHSGAQCNLGFCYHNGQGVREDYAEAVKWYEKAAAQGDADAQRNLGFLLSHRTRRSARLRRSGEVVRKSGGAGKCWCRQECCRTARKTSRATAVMLWWSSIVRRCEWKND